MIFGYRNHNTTNSTFRLIGTTHTDCGNAPNNNNNINNNVSGSNNTATTATGGLSIPGVINSSNNTSTIIGGIGTSFGGVLSTTTNTTTTRPSNYYTSRSVSWNTNGSYLAVAGSALTVRLLNVEYGTTSITNSDSMIPIPGSNSSNFSTATSTTTTTTDTATIQTQQQLITGKEVVAITTGIGGNNVTKVRFHPNDINILCSTDTIVQIWDIRGSTSQRSIGKINIHSGGTAIAIDWNSNTSTSTTTTTNNIIQVTERDNSIYIYDIRKLSSTSTASSSGKNKDTSSSNNNSLCYFKMKQSIYVDTCLFTPDGTSIITGTTSRENGIGQLRIFPWMHNNNKVVPQQQPMILPTLSSTNDTNSNSIVSATYTTNYRSDGITTTSTTTGTSSYNNKTKDVQCNVYSGHAGPIYTMSYSNNKQYLATGGSDASVAIWDVASMCCIQSITRRLKFIRSVAFSSNNTILATSSEEDTIDLAHVPTGQLIGLASFSTTGTSTSTTSSSGGGVSSTPLPSLTSNTSSNRRIGNEGAEEITFHPSKDMYILACARTSMGPISTPPVAILKLHISQ